MSKLFQKESSMAKTAMSLDELRFYREKTAGRLVLIQVAGLFQPEDITRVEDTIADFDRRIARRERKLARMAHRQLSKTALAVGLAS